MPGSSSALLADIERILRLFRGSGQPILGKLSSVLGEVWRLAGGFRGRGGNLRMLGKLEKKNVTGNSRQIEPKIGALGAYSGSKIRGCAAAGVKVGYMGLSRL